MEKKQRNLCTELGNYVQIRDFIEGLFKRKKIDQRTEMETLLVFEALYNDMLDHGVPKDKMVTVWGYRSFGDLKIKIAFDGSIYVPMSDFRDETTVEDKVMLAYAEKIESRYHSGRNHLILTAQRSSLKQTRWNLLALAVAIMVYIPIAILSEKSGNQEMIDEYVYQIEKLFTDAILCVGAPVTFFSMLRNLTDMFVVAEGNLGMRKVEFNAILTSIITVILAILTCKAIKFPFVFVYVCIGELFGGAVPPYLKLNVEGNAVDILDSIVDSSIFDSFASFAPFPIILLAILTTYALCSAGSYFDSIRKIIEGCYVLFSKMLSAIMYLLPFFSFMAMLDLMLKKGVHATVFVFTLTLFVPLTMIIMQLFYFGRLIVAGINPRAFSKKLSPLVKQNMLINSTIEAVPFNTRYCVTKYGMDRKRLDESLPILARVNLDGNCFVITLIAVVSIFVNGRHVTMFDVTVIGILVFFLSLGAPNQPGSILIGLMVIINYLNIPAAIPLAIYSEAMFGVLLSVTNAVGDIITVAVDDQRAKKHALKERAAQGQSSSQGKSPSQ